MTKREYFEELKGYVADNAELVEFLDRQIELVSKKRNTETKTQKENAETVEKIYNYMAETGKPVTIAEIVTEFGLTSGQKASALVKKLVDAGKVVRAKDGKTAVYSIAE